MKSLKLLLRFATVGGLILLLLIPLLLIRGAVQDRARYRDEAVERVSKARPASSNSSRRCVCCPTPSRCR